MSHVDMSFSTYYGVERHSTLTQLSTARNMVATWYIAGVVVQGMHHDCIRLSRGPISSRHSFILSTAYYAWHAELLPSVTIDKSPLM